ncbi:LysR family transcriptional regulator [Novosphingopyxis sp.]|uniref:LysR family transcriptional regulator n=1 Tax=Novosphingopyxis sp. TaxID=2709690 RepID=UPI003B5AA201
MRTREHGTGSDKAAQSRSYAIDDLRALAFVADAGSLNAAAKQYSISKSVLSRAIAKLEEAVGGPVFDRTKLGMTLTEIGQVLLPTANRAVTVMRDADEAMRSAGAVPQGRLDIAASALSGQKLVAPAMAAMAKLYPKVNMTLRVTGRGPDPTAEDLDIVLRVGRPIERHLRSKLLLSSPLALYAFRTAAAQHDLNDPKTIERLGRIVIDIENVPPDWKLSNQDGEKLMFDGAPLAHVGDPMVAIGIMNAGSGVAFIPKVYAEPLAKAGAIVRVLPEWTGAVLEIFATTPARRAAVPAVRAFLEVLEREAQKLAAAG